MSAAFFVRRARSAPEQHSVRILFSLPPGSNFAARVNIDVDQIRIAAHRTILHIVLLRSSREIDGYHNIFAARVTGVAGFRIHRFRRVGVGTKFMAECSVHFPANEQCIAADRTYFSMPASAETPQSLPGIIVRKKAPPSEEEDALVGRRSCFKLR